MRWSSAAQLHVTLKFLGDVDNRELPKVCDVLQQICSPVEPFTVQVRGLGTFPRGKPPRVIWAGIEDMEDQPLQLLHTQLDSAFRELGVPSEGRAFAPHLTLGRVQRRVQSSQLLTQLEAVSGSLNTQLEVEEIKVMASIKERTGVIYEPISTIPL